MSFLVCTLCASVVFSTVTPSFTQRLPMQHILLMGFHTLVNMPWWQCVWRRLIESGRERESMLWASMGLAVCRKCCCLWGSNVRRESLSHPIIVHSCFSLHFQAESLRASSWMRNPTVSRLWRTRVTMSSPSKSHQRPLLRASPFFIRLQKRISEVFCIFCIRLIYKRRRGKQPLNPKRLNLKRFCQVWNPK